MLSERFRPNTWDDFVGQPTIDEIREALEKWERQLFESISQQARQEIADELIDRIITD